MKLPFTKYAALLLAVSVVGCVSRGSAIKRLGDDRYEVRAWDGYGCRKESDNTTCFNLLMPVVKERAMKQCGRDIELASLCTRYEASTADRVVCTVSCKEKAEGGDDSAQGGDGE